jgi:hypothetical protein
VRRKIFEKSSSVKSFEVLGKCKECAKGLSIPRPKLRRKSVLFPGGKKDSLKEKGPSPLKNFERAQKILGGATQAKAQQSVSQKKDQSRAFEKYREILHLKESTTIAEEELQQPSDLLLEEIWTIRSKSRLEEECTWRRTDPNHRI